MYAIEKGMKQINGVVVDTFIREGEEKLSEFKVEAGTTGYTGCAYRDGGGRTYLGLSCPEGDYFFHPVKDEDDRVVGIQIAACGDEGLNVIMKMLMFAYEALRDQIFEAEE